jgi:hypothetical protein
VARDIHSGYTIGFKLLNLIEKHATHEFSGLIILAPLTGEVRWTGSTADTRPQRSVPSTHPRLM